MEFNCNVTVVDSIMGSGKTEAIINHINKSSPEDKFIVITPFLTEVKRYRDRCPGKKFKEPQFNAGSKFNDFKRLLSNGENIVSTHVMFQKFDQSIMDLCRAYDYTLIMDEVANVVEEFNITKDDYAMLMEYTNVNPETKQLHWKEEYADYSGKFDDEKRLCDLGSLVIYGDSLMVWLFPIEVFNSFRQIFILTYMFDAQLQRYYYDYYGLPYKYAYVNGEFGSHKLCDDPQNAAKHDYSQLIHILNNEKMNQIGNCVSDLSKTWYDRNKHSLKPLKNNIYNFFFNITNSKSNDCIWTTFKEYEYELRGKGYTKGFLPINARATNEYRDRTSVAYLVNRYLNPFVKNFFLLNNVSINEDGYALSEMLQFIWRSAIRERKEIYVYVPSVRMRTLLTNWIGDTN